MLQVYITEIIVKSTDSTSQPKNKSKITLSIDLRLVCLLLVIALLACLALWRPWTSAASSDSRTIEVTGEATLKAAPDEYKFNPNYQFDSETKAAALADLTKKSNEVIAGLKQLGIKDSMIKSNSNGYENQSSPEFGGGKVSYNLQLTITVDDESLVQKVQDYLVTTSPTGPVSPNATFSETTRKSLERKGRTAATADARKKADQSAQELDFKVQKVKSISDTSQNAPDIYPVTKQGIAEDVAPTQIAQPSIGVQSGQNELTYIVTVVYYIK